MSQPKELPINWSELIMAIEASKKTSDRSSKDSSFTIFFSGSTL
jgi:hypothetical protein